jgi:hypothetical protein
MDNLMSLIEYITDNERVELASLPGAHQGDLLNQFDLVFEIQWQTE